MAKEVSASFFVKKEAKKLSFPCRDHRRTALVSSAGAIEQSFFASFCSQKEESFP